MKPMLVPGSLKSGRTPIPNSGFAFQRWRVPATFIAPSAFSTLAISARIGSSGLVPAFSIAASSMHEP